MNDQINSEKLPRHIAVIMDGNGRWARQKGAARIFGHRHAIQAVRDICEGCGELGVKYLTLYAFSTENWSRPKEEVDGLMELLVDALQKEMETLQKNNVRLSVIGDVNSLPGSCQRKLKESMEETAGNSGLNVILALSYSGRWEITDAVRKIARAVADGKLLPEDITEKNLSDHLNTSGIPDPELLIRSGGEMRISNFLLWQLAYTELYITDKFWPDFRKNDLFEAIIDFQKRERRFGKVLEPHA
ncbi:MAG: isoprenyl transferase [Cyclobacteriaceae bacterium]